MLEEMAVGLAESGRQAERIATFDIAWPADSQEYRAMGKYGIVLLGAVSAQQHELPMRRTYLRVDGVDIPLFKLASFPRRVDSVRLRMTVGAYREDSFYLIPARATRRTGALLADFAANRLELLLATLPFEAPAFILNDRDIGVVEPRADAVIAMMTREYPGYLRE